MPNQQFDVVVAGYTFYGGRYDAGPNGDDKGLLNKFQNQLDGGARFFYAAPDEDHIKNYMKKYFSYKRLIQYPCQEDTSTCGFIPCKSPIIVEIKSFNK